MYTSGLLKINVWSSYEARLDDNKGEIPFYGVQWLGFVLEFFVLFF